MTRESITQLVEHLTQAGPLTAERFAALLGATLTPSETNPYWQTLVFELASGPFTRGEVRLKVSGEAALLILEPRNPPGLGRADVDEAALGRPVGIEPNPRIPPAGVVTEYFLKGETQVAAQWDSGTNRLRHLVVSWEPPAPAAPQPSAGPTTSARLN